MPSRKDKLIGANLCETINQLRESWKHLHIHHGGNRKLTMSTVYIWGPSIEDVRTQGEGQYQRLRGFRTVNRSIF